MHLFPKCFKPQTKTASLAVRRLPAVAVNTLPTPRYPLHCFFTSLLLCFSSPPRWVEHPLTAPSSCHTRAPVALLLAWSLPDPDRRRPAGACILRTPPRTRRCPSMEVIQGGSMGSRDRSTLRSERRSLVFSIYKPLFIPH